MSIKIEDLYDLVKLVGEGTYGQVFKAIAKFDIQPESSRKSVRREESEPTSNLKNGTSRRKSISSTSPPKFEEPCSAGYPGVEQLIPKGSVVAIKRIRFEKEGLSITTAREIRFLKGTCALKEGGSQFCCKILHVFYDQEGTLNLVFPYLPFDISGLISHKSVCWSLSSLKWMLQQLLMGLKDLHDKGIIHRDIKGSNLLVTENCRLVLADFGLAKQITPFYGIWSRRSGANEDSELDERCLTNRVVTLWYRAHELLLGECNYGPEVDVWSVGCIFLEMANILLAQGKKSLSPNNFVASPPIPASQENSVNFGGIGSSGNNSPASFTQNSNNFSSSNYAIPPSAAVSTVAPHVERFGRFFTAVDELSHLEQLYKLLGYPDEKVRSDYLINLPWYSMVCPTSETVDSGTLEATFSNCIGSNGISLLRSMLDYDPRSRISAAEALDHEFFREKPRARPLDLTSLFGSEYHEFEAKQVYKASLAAAAAGVAVPK